MSYYLLPRFLQTFAHRLENHFSVLKNITKHEAKTQQSAEVQFKAHLETADFLASSLNDRTVLVEPTHKRLSDSIIPFVNLDQNSAEEDYRRALENMKKNLVTVYLQLNSPSIH